ncbi:hypothetical protein [Candidatus Sodalis pierantonius]|nr:hypothetical protein [Candidatus Sodalis pierantonius]
MTNPIPTAEETSLAALAGELRISLGKLVRRLRAQRFHLCAKIGVAAAGS